MRILDSTSVAYLAARTGVTSRYLVHIIIARDRDIGLPEALGPWRAMNTRRLRLGSPTAPIITRTV